jgi:hypothetical protein
MLTILSLPLVTISLEGVHLMRKKKGFTAEEDRQRENTARAAQEGTIKLFQKVDEKKAAPTAKEANQSTGPKLPSPKP